MDNYNCTTQLKWNENKTTMSIENNLEQGLLELLHVPHMASPSLPTAIGARYTLNN